MEWKDQFSEVQPVRPVAAYIGGKRNLAQRVCALIEDTPHDAYAEAFVGMGGIFFRRRLRPKVEIINDWSKDVSTLFRVLQRHYQAFLEMIRWQLATRAEFERLMATDPDTLTDLERAARFLYVQRLAFSGKVINRAFAVRPVQSSRFNVATLAPMLEDVHARLSGVTIERLHYADFVRRYDRPGLLIYFDPPYWGDEREYGRELFKRDDFEQLADVMGSMKGRFIMSINDRPEVRRVFRAFDMTQVTLKYTMAAGTKKTEARELIVTPAGRSRTVAA